MSIWGFNRVLEFVHVKPLLPSLAVLVCVCVIFGLKWSKNMLRNYKSQNVRFIFTNAKSFVLGFIFIFRFRFFLHAVLKQTHTHIRL